MRFLTNGKKVGEIELFRFIFAIFVMLLHSLYLFEDNKSIVAPGGAFGVEFFFLVSGFLMMATLEKLSKNSTPINNIGKETVCFIFKKIRTFFPELAVSSVIGFVFIVIVRNLNRLEILKLISNSFFEITLLERTGLGNNSINGALWYIQSMLLAMIILYPLIRKFPNLAKWLLLPLGAILLLGYLQQNFTHLRSPHQWVENFTFKGNIRAVAELCLGAECYFAVQWLKKFRFRWFVKAFLTIVKWACWLLIIWYMCKPKDYFSMDFFFLAVMCVGVILAFSKQCIDTPIYQNVFMEFLGKLSLPIYLSHIFYAMNLKYIFPKHFTVNDKMITYLICTAITTIIVMIFAKLIRISTPKVINTFNKLALVK